MNSKLFYRILIISSFIVCLFSYALSETGDSILYPLLTGEISDPLTFTFSSFSFPKLSQYGEERTENLNRLLKHFSFGINIDGPVSETSLSIDKEPVFSITDIQQDGRKLTRYSFAPDTVIETYEGEGKVENTTFGIFLEDHFFALNRLMDNLYPVFEKMAECFPEFSRTEKVNLSFKEYGKATQKVTVRFPKDFVKEQYSQTISTLTDMEETTSFIRQLTFDGVQKIILLFDADHHLIRIYYDGMVGSDQNSLRKVSINWKCTRSDEQIKDDLILKTPSVKGNNKYNVSYQRKLDLSLTEQQQLDCNLELDLREGEFREKIQYKSQICCMNRNISGEILFSDRQNSREKKIILIPLLQKENEAEYTGSLEIVEYSGKIVNGSFKSQLGILRGNRILIPEIRSSDVIQLQSDQGKRAAEFLQYGISSLVFRKLLSLPEDDIIFLSGDIPTETWDSVVDSLYVY